MNNEPNNTGSRELDTNGSESVRGRGKKRVVVVSLLILVLIFAGIYILLNSSDNSETVKKEGYRFVNNNSVLCTHSIEQNEINCTNVDTGQSNKVAIPDEYKNLVSVQPSHDGTKLLVSLSSDTSDFRYVVTDTAFRSSQEVKIPYEDADKPTITPEVIWGNDSDSLLISKQIREENDAEFLPAPYIVWDYDIDTREARRIFKNGDSEEPTIKLVGASNDHLFITQHISKNWVAQDTDPPANALLAVRLDDGFVRVVDIEQVVKLSDRNKYVSVLSFKYDPVTTTLYISGQIQLPDTDYQNLYLAAKLVDENGLYLEEISRLTSQAQYYGITSTRGTLVADWSDELEGFNYSFVASQDEVYEIQNTDPAKDNSRFTIATLPVLE